MSKSAKEKVSAEITMGQLWSRVQQRGDLPGFSKTVRVLIGAMRGDDNSSEFNMTRTVLSDPALTQKVLRLANSSMYSAYGRDINTVSKAVMLLGTNAIGHLALSLKLIEEFSAASAESKGARGEMEKAVLAGHIARQVASSSGSRDAEEAAVCSVLHATGRMMVAFYLPEQWKQIQERCAEMGQGEEEIARDVLGLGLDEVGCLAGKRWGLPETLTETLLDVPPRHVNEPLNHTEWLATVATLSSRCAEVLRDENASAPEALSSLVGDYANMLGLEAPQVLTAVWTGQEALVAEDMVGMPHQEARQAGRRTVQRNLGGKPAEAVDILCRGVADLRTASESLSTGQLLTMALEVVYQGLGFSRAVVFLHDRKWGQYAGRMCFGDGTEELLPLMVFGDAYQPDVFHAALANDKIVLVDDAQAPSFASKLPRWWKTSLPTVRSFMVLPLAVNRQPIGFIYGDWGTAGPAAKVEGNEIVQLNELRSLVEHKLEQGRRNVPV